jgi:predicted nucleotidyltransferase component of viral defense system
MNLREEINKLKDEGYSQQNAQARICQDIILDTIAKCHLSQNITIKGGVVMRNISNDVRRATVDLDFDFIKKSISNDSIKLFVNQLNTVSNITITIIGKIEELKQQDYKGKRVHISISDGYGISLTSKMDIGIHKDLDITQEEYCFDICFHDDGASLLMNSKEQILVEKLKSILKHDITSTRFKDIFDICYLSDKASDEKLKLCIKRYIFEDKTLDINTKTDIVTRMERILNNKLFISNIKTSKKNWLDLSLEEVLQKDLEFIRNLNV